jgi:hypothetical protein
VRTKRFFFFSFPAAPISIARPLCNFGDKVQQAGSLCRLPSAASGIDYRHLSHYAHCRLQPQGQRSNTKISEQTILWHSAELEVRHRPKTPPCRTWKRRRQQLLIHSDTSTQELEPSDLHPKIQVRRIFLFYFKNMQGTKCLLQPTYRCMDRHHRQRPPI